jgi:beta-aspartyl-peptidase (threonine type)
VHAAKVQRDQCLHICAGKIVFGDGEAFDHSPLAGPLPERGEGFMGWHLDCTDIRLAMKLGWFDAGLKYGTVGAVAVDADGHVAAATSTGGLTGKRWGRIGDSPLIGAGTYADNRAAAVSCTGSGEQFMRVGAAHEICARIRLGQEAAQTATEAILAEIGAMDGVGGIIFATPAGETGFAFTTPGLFRGRADSGGLREVAIFRED